MIDTIYESFASTWPHYWPVFFIGIFALSLYATWSVKPNKVRFNCLLWSSRVLVFGVLLYLIATQVYLIPIRNSASSNYSIYSLILAVVTSIVLGSAYNAVKAANSAKDQALCEIQKAKSGLIAAKHENLRVAAFLDVIFQLVSDPEQQDISKRLLLIQTKIMFDCQRIEEALVVAADLSIISKLSDSLLPSGKRYIKFLIQHENVTPKQKEQISKLLM